MAWWDDAAEALGSVVGFFAGNDGNDALWFAITTPRNGRPVQVELRFASPSLVSLTENTASLVAA